MPAVGAQPVEQTGRPLDFAEHAGWPSVTDAKRELRRAARFNDTHFARLCDALRFLPQFVGPREGDPPVTHDKPPHYQLTQQAPRSLLPIFTARATDLMAASLPKVHLAPQSPGPVTACFRLDEAIRLPAGVKPSGCVRDFVQIHAEYQPQLGQSARQGGGAGSAHVTLAPADARTLVEHSWAEWRPAADEAHPVVLLYAPRDGAELEFCLRVLDASRRFMLSSDFV
jgi:hypothetical protein